MEKTTNDRGKGNVDNQSIGYNGTSKQLLSIPTNKQTKANNSTINKESIGNSREELDNSSFFEDKRFAEESKKIQNFIDKSKVKHNQFGNRSILFNKNTRVLLKWTF